MPVHQSRVLFGLVLLVLGLPPLAVLMARSSGDMVSWVDFTFLMVELVVASGLVLAWHLRRYLPHEAEPTLLPVPVPQPARSSKVG